MHLALNTGWIALFHAMPIKRSGDVVGDDSSASVEMRRLRATRPIAFVGPIAAACVIPGLITVVVARFSWQPPHTRASPGRAENHTGSFSRDIPNTSTACRWSGTFAGTVASQLPSDATRATPRVAWPLHLVG